VIVAVTSDGPQAESVSDAIASDTRLSRLVQVPDRFVSGESGALISAINGKAAVPPGVKTRTSDAGVRNQPALLSNAETFAQLAVLGMLGPAGYASAGIASEPGTVLLTVGGWVTHPAVFETPTGAPLGHVLDICGGQPPGVVLVLSADSCPLGEVARVAGCMAMQSSGQCGPCKAGLPAVARSLAALAAGAGGPDELEAVRRTAAGVRGRGACHHPDGTANFVASALDVFAADVAEHMFRGTLRAADARHPAAP
jgi:NADH:ubiquinone oxidoreductase subunit F (NADH-binding)